MFIFDEDFLTSPLVFVPIIVLGILVIDILTRSSLKEEKVFLSLTKNDKKIILITDELTMKKLDRDEAVALKCNNNYYQLTRKDRLYERIESSVISPKQAIPCETL